MAEVLRQSQSGLADLGLELLPDPAAGVPAPPEDIPDDEPGIPVDEAALMIQSAFRGHVVRKKLRAVREGLDEGAVLVLVGGADRRSVLAGRLVCCCWRRMMGCWSDATAATDTGSIRGTLAAEQLLMRSIQAWQEQHAACLTALAATLCRRDGSRRHPHRQQCLRRLPRQRHLQPALLPAPWR
jgi:hypothetical protein